jgi:hypothetical protein
MTKYCINLIVLSLTCFVRSILTLWQKSFDFYCLQLLEFQVLTLQTQLEYLWLTHVKVYWYNELKVHIS